MAITRQPFVLSKWKSLCTVLVQSATCLWGHLHISKKHGCHWPMKFEHLLDKVNEGRSERNSVGLFDSWPQRSVRNLKEISHWGGGGIAFFEGVNHWSQTQFLEGHSSAQFSSNPNQTHLIQIIKVFRITRNFQAGVIWSWLELNSAELWPSRNWVWDQWCKRLYVARFSVHTRDIHIVW